MCLLTYIPEDVQPDIEALRRGARVNSDGHGFAIVIPQYGDHGRILVRKSMRAEGLLKEFRSLRELYPHGPAIFHSRITTDGATDLFNCHPFMVGGDKRTIVGHNGILPRSVRPALLDPRSDTRIFAEEVAKGMRLHTAIGRDLAGEWMGSYNKMAILTVDPVYSDYGYIINEDAGQWYEGIWYSNGSFKGAGARSYNNNGGSYSLDPKTGEWVKWEWCTVRTCQSGFPSVSPYSLRCSVCKTCSVCDFEPCECYVEKNQGKATSSPSVPKGADPKGSTIVVGSPKSGATVQSARNAANAYVTSAAEYWEAIDAARDISRGLQPGDYVYDVDPEDDGADQHPSQLEQVLAMVDHLNSGGDLEDLAPDEQEVIIEHALAALEHEGLLERGESLGWPPDSDGNGSESDGEPQTDVGVPEAPRGDLIKRGDPSDDQDAMMLASVSAPRGLWDVD